MKKNDIPTYRWTEIIASIAIVLRVDLQNKRG